MSSASFRATARDVPDHRLPEAQGAGCASSYPLRVGVSRLDKNGQPLYGLLRLRIERFCFHGRIQDTVPLVGQKVAFMMISAVSHTHSHPAPVPGARSAPVASRGPAALPDFDTPTEQWSKTSVRDCQGPLALWRFERAERVGAAETEVI